MTGNWNIPRVDEVESGGLNDQQVKGLLGLIANSLEMAQDALMIGIPQHDTDLKAMTAYAAVAQAHSAQAQSLTLYLMLFTGLDD